MTEITHINSLHLAEALAALNQATPATCAPAHQSDLSAAEVVEVADLLGIDFAMTPFDLEDLQLGLAVEREQEYDCAPATDDLPDEDLVELGKVAIAHLKEEPDYYTWLTQAHAPGDPTPLSYSHADLGTD